MIDFSSITNSWGYILEGVKYTIELTVITAIGGFCSIPCSAVLRLNEYYCKWILISLSKLYPLHTYF